MSLTPSLQREAEPYATRLERPPPPSKHTYSPLNVRDLPSQNNFLANALNQTFRLNSTTAASHVHVPTTPLFVDATSPVSNAVISPTVKPQYRNFGVQKNLNFTRHTSSTVGPSEDLSSCIMRLEAEKRDLQAQAEKYKHECEVYQESLSEINRMYNSPGHRYHPPLSSGPSNFIPHPPLEFSIHPRWRTRITTDSRIHPVVLEELDFPPIEALPLPTPSSPESTSHRRRRRGPSDPTNGRRQGGNPQGLPFLDRSERLIRNTAPPNPAATGEAGVSSTSPTITVDVGHDKG